MMKKLLTFVFFICQISSLSLAAGRIQNEDIKTLAELIAGGGNVTQLPNDTKVYLTNAGLVEQLSSAIGSGDVCSKVAPPIFGQFATPAPPSAGFNKCYTKVDNKFYCENSAGVETLIGPSGVSPVFTPGSVIFADALGNLAEDNANFFWDFTNFRLGVATNAPTVSFDVNGNARIRGLTIAGPVSTDALGNLSSLALLPTSEGGTNHANFTQGSVIFAGVGGLLLDEDNADFFWDNTLKQFQLNNATLIQSKSVVDSGIIGLQFGATSDTTIAGSSSNTTIGVNGNATAIVRAGAQNDKALAAIQGTTIRGDGTDDGILDTMFGVVPIMIHNSGIAGTTPRAFVFNSGFINQQGTVGDLYDWKPEYIPAGGTLSGTHYGIYEAFDGIGVMQHWLSGFARFGGNAFVAPTFPIDVTGSIKTDTSLFLEDPGAGVNTVEIQAPSPPTASYTLILPIDAGVAGQIATSAGPGLPIVWGAASGVSATTGFEPEQFILNGGLGGALTDFDGVRRAENNKTISKIVACLYNSGVSGQTDIQVNYGAALGSGVAFNIPANGGLNCAQATPAAVVVTNDLMDANVIGVATGLVENLSIKIIFGP